MKTYILSLLSASLIAAVAELLTPKGEGGRMASHIRMVAGLYLLVTLLTPLREGVALLRSLSDGDLSARVDALLPVGVEDDYNEVFGDALVSVSAEEIRSWMLQAMESRFGIPPEGCDPWAECAYDGETLTVTEVRISLHGAYVLRDPIPIETYFAEQLGCPCYVTVG